MRVRRAIKKIAALGVGAGMLATTLLGAMAADLADFPKPLFINDDGTFNGKFVFGKLADAEDVLGANAITAAVQVAAVVKTQVTTGGAVVTVLGDSAQIAASGDILELNERLGNVKASFTDDNLGALKGGKISNEHGTTDYNQYLRFETNTNETTSQVGDTDDSIDSGKVKWAQNEDEDVGDFLYFEDGDAMFEYEIEFEKGVESDIDTNDRMEDLEDRDINIIGKTFTVTKAEISSAEGLELTLLGGEWSGVMEEGESTTVTIGDKEYDIDVLVITATPLRVKFRINGETTEQLAEGETGVLSDGTNVGVREILENEAGEEGFGDIVEFYLGAQKIVWDDDDTTNQNFDAQGSTEVDSETVSVGYVMMRMTNTSTKATLTDIKYRLVADPLAGEDDVLIPSGDGLRAYLDEDDGALGMLHSGWDIVYKGLSPVTTTDFKIDASGDDKYTFDFTNVNGDEFTNIPFIDNSNGNFVVGKDKTGRDRMLHWEEDAIAGFTIEKNDYFICTSKNDTNGLTYVLKFDSMDNSSTTVQFTTLAGGTIEATYDDAAANNEGELILGGKSYTMYVNSNESLAIDFDGDGSVDDGEKATIIIKGGGIISLGADQATDELTGSNDILVQLFTKASEFDENGIVNNTIGDPKSDWDTADYKAEKVVINISDAGSSTVTLAVASNNDARVGALQTYDTANAITHNDLCNLYTLENIDDDKSQCMTPFGVLVEYYNPTGTTEANEVTFSYPDGQREALVYVEAGVTTTATSEAGVLTTETIVPIPSTASVLDIEVTNPKSQNLIIVGGPCANSVASAVSGIAQTWPECAAGVEAGKAIIKLLDSADGMAAGKVAMLVYGFNPGDTRLASQIVANYKDYTDKFVGKELEVTGTSLTDVTIGVPTAG